MVFGHLQEIHLQRPSFCGPPKFRQFAAKPHAAKPDAATFLPLAALLLTGGHLQQPISLQVVLLKMSYFRCKCPILLQMTCCK